jgi:peroxiredoxin Q/BCP
MNPGDRAPDFELPATGPTAAGGKVKLSDFRGKKTVVLYFYPKDETPGCTVEACSFRDEYEDFSAAGAEVIGVSDDGVASHEKFATHHKLPFILATDDGGKLREQMGVKKTLGMLKGRVTFVIDRDGVIRDRFESQVRVKKHVSHALDLVKQLEKR